jgi:pimeloyl-ACP methyl ester carboxylesterase
MPRVTTELCAPRLASPSPRSAPTLVLRGEDSIVTSAEGMTALADGLPNRQVREIKGGSHMLLLEHPKDVARIIRDFLRTHLP